jgi:hypothetical protein
MSVDNTIKHILTEVQSRPSPPSEVSEDKLFDELFGGSVEEYGEALKKLTDTANDKTIDIRVARDDAFKAYTRLNRGFELCWRQAWKASRIEMILEATNERT